MQGVGNENEHDQPSGGGDGSERVHRTPFGDIRTGTMEVAGQRFMYRDYSAMFQQQERRRADVSNAVCLQASDIFGERRDKVYTFVTTHSQSPALDGTGDTVYCVRRHIDDGVANPADKSTWKYTISIVACSLHDDVAQAQARIAEHAATEGWERLGIGNLNVLNI